MLCPTRGSSAASSLRVIAEPGVQERRRRGAGRGARAASPPAGGRARPRPGGRARPRPAAPAGGGQPRPRPPRAPGRSRCPSAAARSRSSTRERGPAAGRPREQRGNPARSKDPRPESASVPGRGPRPPKRGLARLSRPGRRAAGMDGARSPCECRAPRPPPLCARRAAAAPSPRAPPAPRAASFVEQPPVQCLLSPTSRPLCEPAPETPGTARQAPFPGLGRARVPLPRPPPHPAPGWGEPRGCPSSVLPSPPRL